MVLSRRTRAALATAVLMVGLGACSDDGGSDQADRTTTTKAADGTTTTGADDGTTTTGAGDDRAEARAEAANLTLDDLPDGWTAEPAESEDDDSVFVTCGEVDLDEITLAVARSDQFSLDQGAGQLSLSTTSRVFADEADAGDLMAAVASDAFAECASDEFVEAVGVPGMEGELVPFPDVPTVGDETAALQGSYTLEDPTSGAPVQIDVLAIAVRTGDLLTTVSAAAIDTEGDGDLLQDVLETVAERQAG